MVCDAKICNFFTGFLKKRREAIMTTFRLLCNFLSISSAVQCVLFSLFVVNLRVPDASIQNGHDEDGVVDEGISHG